MNWRPRPDGICKCGSPEPAHLWLCNDCGTPAKSVSRCGCGRAHLPVPGCECSGGWSLYCPESVRIIDDEEWRDYQAALRMIRRAGSPFTIGRFHAQEAERLRGLSA